MNKKLLLPLLTVTMIAGSVGSVSAANSATADNLTKVRELYQAGEVDEARDLAESLGLEAGRGMRFGGPFAGMTDEEITAKKAELDAQREKVDAAITAGDFETWKSLVQDEPHGSFILEKITADNFAKFAEMHSLQEKARAIADELGIGMPGRGGPMMGGEMPMMRGRAGSGSDAGLGSMMRGGHRGMMGRFLDSDEAPSADGKATGLRGWMHRIFSSDDSEK